MDSGEIAKRLAKLAPREKEVLHLRCQGLKYKDVGLRLGITLETVKSHMGHFYDKVGLSELGLSNTQLWEQLFKVYCPVFQQNWVEVTQPGTTAEDNLALQLVPSEKALVLVDLSEDLVPWERPEPPMPPRTTDGGAIIDGHVSRPAPQLPPPSVVKPKSGPNSVLMLFGGALLGIFLCLILGGLAWWLFFRNQKPLPVALVSATPTVVLATPTPVLPAATAVPVVETKIVVVTATPPPATSTPQASVTPVPPTNTPVPSDTPLPTATATASVPLPFSDNFDQGLTALWKPQTGTWRMVNGRLTADPSDLMSLIMVGDENWTNYTVNVDVYNYDWNYPVRVIVRAAGGNYLAFQTNCCNTDWFLVSGPDEKSIAHFDKGGLKFSGFTGFMKDQIRVEVSGQTYSGYVDGKLYLQVQDATLTSGAVGLAFQYAFNDTTQFDNFMVSAP
jgi:Sigma-70, region 4